MTTQSFKIAKSVARNNSRRNDEVWVVYNEFGPHSTHIGYNVEPITHFVPNRAIAAFRKGKPIKTDDIMTQLAIACGNHPYEDGA